MSWRTREKWVRIRKRERWRSFPMRNGTRCPRRAVLNRNWTDVPIQVRARTLDTHTSTAPLRMGEPDQNISEEAMKARLVRSVTVLASLAVVVEVLGAGMKW